MDDKHLRFSDNGGPAKIPSRQPLKNNGPDEQLEWTGKVHGVIGRQYAEPSNGDNGNNGDNGLSAVNDKENSSEVAADNAREQRYSNGQESPVEKMPEDINSFRVLRDEFQSQREVLRRTASQVHHEREQRNRECDQYRYARKYWRIVTVTAVIGAILCAATTLFIQGRFETRSVELELTRVHLAQVVYDRDVKADTAAEMRKEIIKLVEKLIRLRQLAPLDDGGVG